MRTVVVCSFMALLCQQCLVTSHILGRPSSTSDLEQLKSLLERFEETLAEDSREEEPEAVYEETNPEPEHGPSSRGWNLDQESLVSERAQPSTVGRSRTPSPRSRLQDLLLTMGKRASNCFGGRMDRIGNVSGLGCNSGKG